MELLYAEGMLNNARGHYGHGPRIKNPALSELLHKLRDLAYRADDALDEVDYFRIQDELEGTYHAAEEHDGGCLRNHALNARHAARAIAKMLGFSKCSARVVDIGHVPASKLLMMTRRKKKIQGKEEFAGHVHVEVEPINWLTTAAWAGSPPLPVAPSTLLVNTFHFHAARQFHPPKMLQTPMLQPLSVDSSVVPEPTIRHQRQSVSCKHQS
jgi:hypothetical protein